VGANTEPDLLRLAGQCEHIEALGLVHAGRSMRPCGPSRSPLLPGLLPSRLQQLQTDL
jgi:hypothetical protein